MLPGFLVVDGSLLSIDALSELCLSVDVDCVDEGRDSMLSKVRNIPPEAGCESLRTTSSCRLGAGLHGAVESCGPPFL